MSMENINNADALYEVVERNFIEDSKRCKTIINKHTGAKFERLDGRESESQRWACLYKHASVNSINFELIYDSVGKDIKKFYKKEELESMDIRKLQEIAQPIGIKGRQKVSLVNAILTAQELVEEL